MSMQHTQMTPTNSGTAGSTVYTSHYDGPDHTGTSLDLITDTPGRSSFGFTYAPSFGFNNRQNEQTFERLMDFSIGGVQIGDYIITNSSNKKIAEHWKDVGRYGINPTVNHDDLAVYMDGWINATVGNHALEYVERPTTSGFLIEGPEVKIPYSKFSPMTDVEGYVKPIIAEEININEVGKLFSQNANADNWIRNFLYRNYIAEPPWYDTQSGQYTYHNDNSVEFVRHLLANNIDQIRDVLGTGSGDLAKGPTPAEAMTIYRPNNSIFLVLHSNLYQNGLTAAKALGFKGTKAHDFAREYANYVIGHEVVHSLERESDFLLPEMDREIRIGDIQEWQYRNGSEARANTWKGQLYGLISRIAGLYANAWRSGQVGKNLYGKLESLVLKYGREANSFGKGDEEADEYVVEKLEKYISNVPVGEDNLDGSNLEGLPSEGSKSEKVDIGSGSNENRNSDTAGSSGELSE